MLASLAPRPDDSLLSLIKAYEQDPRTSKIDLGVGVYRNEVGATPVFAAVKEAEAHLLETQVTKAYLGPEGDVGFVDAMALLAMGNLPGHLSFAGVQTPGGTGALRVLIELWQRANPDGTVWLGLPSWPVHATILQRLGVNTQTYSHYDLAAQKPSFDALLDAASSTGRGDLLLLHGCCHNPTGADPDTAHWEKIGAALARTGAIPLVDLAYQGLGDGIDEDTRGLRILMGHVPELLLAYSCDKNFGLYRDRVGAAYVVGAEKSANEISLGHMAEIARSCWSMPPDHGGALVRLIMEDSRLSELWRDELDGMRMRINRIRQVLASEGVFQNLDFGRLCSEKGMFAMLPIPPSKIERLRIEHGIYMVGNGRINLAGLTEQQCGTFVGALRAVVFDAKSGEKGATE